MTHTARARRLLATLAIVACGTPPAPGRETLPDDAATLARIARRHPCPASVPRAWLAADPTLGTGPRCSLVTAAAAAIRAAPPEAGIAGVDPERVACVRIASFAFRDVQTEQMSKAYWSVEFIQARDVAARAVIDRRSGRIEVGRLHNEFDMPLAHACSKDGAR